MVGLGVQGEKITWSIKVMSRTGNIYRLKWYWLVKMSEEV